MISTVKSSYRRFCAETAARRRRLRRVPAYHTARDGLSSGVPDTSRLVDLITLLLKLTRSSAGCGQQA